MKVTIVTEEKEFKPITIDLRVESAQELFALKQMFEIVADKFRVGMRAALAQQLYNSLKEVE